MLSHGSDTFQVKNEDADLVQLLKDNELLPKTIKFISSGKLFSDSISMI